MNNFYFALKGQMSGFGADTAGIILAAGIAGALVLIGVAHVIRSRK